MFARLFVTPGEKMKFLFTNSIKMKQIFAIYSLCIFISCNSNSPIANSVDTVSKKINIEERSTINPKPVKTYHETIKSFETTDEFNVALFETKSVFRYLIKVSFKNYDAEDTLRIPDFGIIPSVDIVKGDKRPSCIVGFFDKDSSFKESKLIYFEDDMVKIHVLKYYGVQKTTSPAE